MGFGLYLFVSGTFLLPCNFHNHTVLRRRKLKTHSFLFFKTLLNYAVRTHLHTSVSFLDGRGIIHEPQVSALPLPSPSFQETKQQVQHTPVTTLLQQIVHKVILNWRKMERTNSVKCPVLHMNVLHCNIPTAFPATSERQRVRKQWNAFARVLLDAKPVTSLEVNQAIRVQGRPYDC